MNQLYTTWMTDATPALFRPACLTRTPDDNTLPNLANLDRSSPGQPGLDVQLEARDKIP